MRIDTVIKPKNPLDIPEIHALVATYLARRDLVICLRVSRGWFNYFVGPVWHTIDMVKDKKFAAIGPQVLHTYGRCIREVFNILTFDHVKTLQHPKVDSVVTASITNLIKPLDRLLELDFIRRCNATLTELDFRGQAPQSNSSRKVYERDENFFDIGILSSCLTSPTSSSTVGTRLTSLTLTGMWLSHEGFTNLLRSSPTLRKLALSKVSIVHYMDEFDIFRDSSVTSLHASLEEICMPDPRAFLVPSLLHQFSRLEEWHLTSVDRCKTWGNDPEFRRELRECCPRLKTLRFDQVGNTDKLSDLLLDSFIEPESCTFSAKNLSNSMVLSLISHLDTLTTIIITDKCTDAAAIRWLYLIPKSCLRLKVLSMRDLILDMETVKEHEWRCEELTELHVRFKRLEDAQLIDGCIKDICNRRQLRRRSPQDYMSSQVSNHLFGFIMLTTVSLGSKVYSLSPFRE
ncbi:hypothetical protein KI688_010591 [Linnemannia hyalina]|uniref:F-box domain-containing protein n=1 Tax=Linnemannia hyalina TaxID=64524 RepID=A0A9P7XVX2_9FUNG|nr:hypothetical protein KI688_010591 [Linnemannia hyalina]